MAAAPAGLAANRKVALMLQRHKAKRLIVAQYRGAAMHFGVNPHTFTLQPVAKRSNVIGQANGKEVIGQRQPAHTRCFDRLLETRHVHTGTDIETGMSKPRKNS